MKIIGIGDNVVDYYQDLGLMFPGGNALNVAVLCKRSGASQASYIGILGTDKAGDHVLACLEEESIDMTRIRRAIGLNGEAIVSLDEQGDRIFVGSNKGGIQSLLSLRLHELDLKHINDYDIVHTSVFSNLETELPKLSHKDISFDFSTRMDVEYLQFVCPHIQYAFISGSGLNEEECTRLIYRVHEFGTPIVGITRGGSPAIFSREGEIYRQSIVEGIAVKDTLGAGDSFIAAFLTSYHDALDMQRALQFAAESAAATCLTYGAFGYGVSK